MKKFKKVICLLLVLFTLLTSNLGCDNFTNKDFIVLEHWFWTSGGWNSNSIIVSYDPKNEGIFCEFIAHNGTFSTSDVSLVQKIEVETNQRVKWVELTKEHDVVYNDYIEILILKNQEVIGYAVLEVSLQENQLDYNAEILEQKLLKKSLTKNEAKKQISEIIDNKGVFRNEKI